MKDLGEEGIAKSLLGGDVTTGTLDNEGTLRLSWQKELSLRTLGMKIVWYWGRDVGSGASRGITSDDFMTLLPASDTLKSPFKAIALPVRSGFKISPSLTVRQE